ncbi:MAG TPA: PIN domain-containing protein [Lacipirellulaceae bacterium]|nr:PIN domain-containing protein [Lacipirellulaceae bacterium]HMP06946.1 PIN domain-containing protein [Lacipirellulaceae bacterium]
MPKSRRAYVDTSALIAFVDRSDSHHERFRRLFADPPSLFTTTLVIAEGHGWFLHRYDRERALQFLALAELMAPLTILSAGPEELTAGAALIRRFADQRLTLVDAVGLHVMAAHKLNHCWSTDFHLGLTGVPLAIHDP